MATVSITIPDVLVPRLGSAARSLYPDLASLSDAALFKRITADLWRNLLANYDSLIAEGEARDASWAETGGIG